jgi:hypothetical protein
MIDRASRDAVFDQLRRAATGRSTAFECENVLLSLQSEDQAIKALRLTMREIIDEHDTSLKSLFTKGSEMRSRLIRWLLFLKTDCDYSWPDVKLPSGVLDFYKPTFFDRLTGAGERIQKQIKNFIESGDYSCWPFGSRAELEQAMVMRRKGLRLASVPPVETAKAACNASNQPPGA